MKINVVMGFFLPVPPVAGGATEKSWHRLAIEFARRGHDVTIISRQWKGWPDDEMRDGVRHLRLRGHDHTGSLVWNLLLDALWSLRVRRRLPAADVTVVNAITLPILLDGTRHIAGKLAVMTGRMPKGQYRIYRNIDRVLAVSTPVLEAVRRENPAAARRAVITGYPIDCSQLAAASRRNPEISTIGFVGRIHREKGLDLFAAALHELARRPGLPRWRLVVCGPEDTTSGGSGQKYARELRAKFSGISIPSGFEMLPATFDPSRLAEILQAMDIFCYPSLATRGETFGLAVAEAMAAGAVPVVSALPCFSDFIRNGDSGITFDHKAAAAPAVLANILGQLLMDSARRERMAHAARESVRRYDFPEYADRLLSDFSTLNQKDATSGRPSH